MSANLDVVGNPPTTPAEQQTRTELAALHRLYVKFGWTDLIFTHLTARNPTDPGRYFIKPDPLLMEEVTASSLIQCDMDGNLISGDHRPNLAGHLIHTAVLQARPEINFTAHTHSRAGAAVSCMAEGVLPLSQHSNMILPTIGYHDYQDVTHAEDECARIAGDLGDNHLLVMRNHGLLACGRTVAECFYYLYYLEMACKIQVDVMGSGAEPILVAEDVVNGLFDRAGPDEAPAFSAGVWPAMLRVLEREAPGYRD